MSLADWISALRSTDLSDHEQVKTKPALKILDFFESIEQSGRLQLIYETKNGLRCSKSMRQLAPVNADWMRIWLRQWDF